MSHLQLELLPGDPNAADAVLRAGYLDDVFVDREQRLVRDCLIVPTRIDDREPFLPVFHGASVDDDDVATLGEMASTGGRVDPDAHEGAAPRLESREEHVD